MKLSPALKALVYAPSARPGPTPAPAHMAEVYRVIAREAARHKVGNRPWITFSAAATITLNSPEALLVLHRVATTLDDGGDRGRSAGERPEASELPEPPEPPVAAAELVREVGLKCIGFNGIPRTINVLGAFRSGLPGGVVAQLATRATRELTTAEEVAAARVRGQRLWQSVYAGVDARLLARLADSHPDLPVHILGSHYGPLFTDPPGHGRVDSSGSGGQLASVGRALTSLLAIGCLRAQTGVAPQVVSHVLGLRKAVADGTWRQEGGEISQGGRAGSQDSQDDQDGQEAPAGLRGIPWLATDEGSTWLLQSIDSIVAALGGSNFGGGDCSGEDKAVQAKL